MRFLGLRVSADPIARLLRSSSPCDPVEVEGPQPTLCSHTTRASSLACRRLELVPRSRARRRVRAAARSGCRRRSPSRSGCGPRRSRRCPPRRSARSGCRGRGVHPAAAVAARRGILAHLEAQVLPAADRGREGGAGADGPPSRTPRGGHRRGRAAPTTKLTARPRARPTAHSRCGQSARGAEWMYTTPRACAVAMVFSVSSGTSSPTT
jgi:hypothetical protein